MIAANDSDQQPWIDWIEEAIDDPNPDKLIWVLVTRGFTPSMRSWV